MQHSYYKIVQKYTVLLIVLYAIEVAFREWVDHVIENSLENAMLRSLLPFALAILFNVLTAVVLYNDMKQRQRTFHYVVIAALFFKPLGVCSFLLYELGAQRNEDHKIDLNSNNNTE